jgi:hypothetical protein
MPENAPKDPLSGRRVPKDLDAEIAQLLATSLSSWLAEKNQTQLREHLRTLLELLLNRAS